MSNNRKRKYGWEEKYTTLGDILGEGGNGTVRLVKENNVDFALKQLKTEFIKGKNPLAKEKRRRFIKEIKTVEDYKDIIPGILPIVDSSRSEYWYVMPKAKLVMDYIKENNLSIDTIVKIGILLAETLEQLHASGISHRDIKPSNIYIYKGVPCFSDFGLVGLSEQDYRDTKTQKALGAIFTIAPEMKRNPKDADGKKADVFSMAKTLWMLLTKDELGFDGIYDWKDKSCGLSYRKQFKSIHLVELEELLRDATSALPEERPDIIAFGNRLRTWIKIKSDSTSAQNSEWNFLSHILFGEYTPCSVQWKDLHTIVNVLSTISKLPVYNHMFFPGGGGLDFVEAEPANEIGCLYIYTSPFCCYVVKPKILHFESFSIDYRWNYFLLELDEIAPVEGANGGKYDELLVEDSPGHYVSGKYAQYGVYDYDTGEKFPENYRTVVRCLRGNFLITEKYGPYNGINGTYDGRHNMCTPHRFRQYIEVMSKVIAKGKGNGIKEESLYFLFDMNPFEEKREQNSEERKKSPKRYINANIGIWNFSDYFWKGACQGKIEYSFCLHPSNISCVFKRQRGQIYTLCKDGYFKESAEAPDIYYVKGKKAAQTVYQFVKKMITEACVSAGYDEEGFCLEVGWNRVCPPSHIVTKEEIVQLMQEADDRTNNMLVLDEDGYAHIIQDLAQAIWYPVTQEAWDAGNMYVGKYSDPSYADFSYELAIFGLYEHLTKNRKVYSDETIKNNMSIETCIEKIKEKMKVNK